MSPRARIGLVATRGYPDVGGIESHLDQLIPRLAGDRWNLDVVVTDVTRRLTTRDAVHGHSLRRHRAFPEKRDWYFSPGLFFDVLLKRRDLLHIHGVNALVPPLAMLAAVLRRVPFVVTLHSGGANTDLRRSMRSTQWKVLAPLLRRSEALIAVSESESATFAAVVGRGPIEVIPNGSFDLSAVSATGIDENLVLSVGRLERYKGHHLLIEALPALLIRRPDAHVRILGTGPYKDDLHRIAAATGVADRVEITSVPPTDRAAMAQQMAGAGAVALLSDYEAHPVVVMEALSLGRPVVSRANSGFVELAAKGLIEAIADDAGPALVAEALDAAMSTLSRPIPALPTWDECAVAVDAVYRRVLGESAPRGGVGVSDGV